MPFSCKGTHVNNFADQEIVNDNARSNLWTSVEPNLEIMVACLPQLYPLSTWFNNSLLPKFIRKEPDTWWHPPPEEIDHDGFLVRDVADASQKAGPGWNSFSSPEIKIEVRDQGISMLEVKEIRRKGECSTNAFDRIENV